MKRLFLIFFSLLFLGTRADSQLSFGLGPQLGVSFSSFPKGISDYYGTGFGGGAHGDLNILKYLTARLSIDYMTFSSDKDKIIALYVAQNPGTTASDFGFSGLNINILSIYASGLGKIPLGGVVTPYGLIGMGLNFISTSDGKATYQGMDVQTLTSDSQTKFGLNFGGGVEFGVPFGSLFAEVEYVLIFTDVENSSHIPVVVGLTVGI